VQFFFDNGRFQVRAPSFFSHLFQLASHSSGNPCRYFFLRRGIGQISDYATDLFKYLCLHLLLLWTLQKQEVCMLEMMSNHLFQFLRKFFFQFGLQLISLKPTGHNFFESSPNLAFELLLNPLFQFRLHCVSQVVTCKAVNSFPNLCFQIRGKSLFYCSFLRSGISIHNFNVLCNVRQF